MAPTNSPSSGAAISSLSPRSQIHVVIAISILLGFVYSFRRRSKAASLQALIPSQTSSLHKEKFKPSIPLETSRAPCNNYTQPPFPVPTLNQEDTAQPEHEGKPRGTERTREPTYPSCLDPEISVPSQPQKWHHVKTIEYDFPSKYAPKSASARASFPQLQKETVQEFRPTLPNSTQRCRRKILEFR